jgi:hypothetical protein
MALDHTSGFLSHAPFVPVDLAHINYCITLLVDDAVN